MTIKELEKIVSSLADRVTALESKPLEIKEEKKIEVASAPAEKEYPIPTEYREIVDSVLNKEFGIQIAPHSDNPVFTFTIIVPDKYSNMPAPSREMYKYDLRPKVISYSEGANAVRAWATKVYENLSNEARAQIVADKNAKL